MPTPRHLPALRLRNCLNVSQAARSSLKG